MPKEAKATRRPPAMSAGMPEVARRQFLTDSARLFCGVGLLGVALALHGKQAKALPPLALRPPGAQPEDHFLGACIRCGMCVRACPYDILTLARPETAVAAGTPYFTARSGPCEMCEDIPCVKACPTGALTHALTDINRARMGLAVLADQETCLNFLGMRCDVCYRVCPLIDQAITLELRPNPRTGRHTMFIPTVHSEHCTGCGKCEKACVTEEASIRVLPIKLVKGSLGEHYRLGWQEKAKAGGHSLVEDKGLVDLPDRLPEGMKLDGHFDPGSDRSPALIPGHGSAVPRLPPGLGDQPAAAGEPARPTVSEGAR